MSYVSALGYVGVTAPDLADWDRFASQVLGMQTSWSADRDRLDIRMDERAWRISVSEGAGGVNYHGWEVPNEQALAALKTHLASQGVEVRDDPGLAISRGVTGLAWCEDLSGNRLEFFYGAHVPKDGFVSPTGNRFVTGFRSDGDLGIGHSVISVPSFVDAEKFYSNILGFRLSDVVEFDPAGLIHFTHCNSRHHSLAWLEMPGPSTLLHLNVEVSDINMVGRALDQATLHGDVITSALGCHSNDHMVSFYVNSPSGFEIEYGCGGRLIDDETWSVSRYTDPSFWGHQRLVAEQ
jgi:2,3-dihydroxybiphenyl 1,2-dioxygenase